MKMEKWPPDVGRWRLLVTLADSPGPRWWQEPGQSRKKQGRVSSGRGKESWGWGVGERHDWKVTGREDVLLERGESETESNPGD